MDRKTFGFVFFAIAAVQVVCIGVAIWAVIRLVEHFTA